MSRTTYDNIYATALHKIVDFKFDEAVVGVFPDMIQRSVPGYSTVISMIGTLAAEYARKGSNCYDLGCSVGAASLAMLKQINSDDCTIVAIDNSPAMIEQCQQNIVTSGEGESAEIKFICDDLGAVAIDNASVVVLSYTLQFIPPEHRYAIIEKIYNGLRPGGVLLLSEKIRFADDKIDQAMIDLHHAFKRTNGYSDLEISQKRTALENVLIPETIPVHMERLHQAGFQQPQVWFQCLNFISILAVKYT